MGEELGGNRAENELYPALLKGIKIQILCLIQDRISLINFDHFCLSEIGNIFSQNIENTSGF